MERNTGMPLDWQCLMSAPMPLSGWPERSVQYLPWPKTLRKEMTTVLYSPVSQASRRVPSSLFRPQNTVSSPVRLASAAVAARYNKQARARRSSHERWRWNAMMR